MNCISQTGKSLNDYKRMPVWLTNRMKEAVKGKRASFKIRKSYEENMKEHEFWQKKK